MVFNSHYCVPYRYAPATRHAVGEKNTHHSRECWPRRVLCFQVISVYELGMCGVMTPLVATVECSIFGRNRLKRSAHREKNKLRCYRACEEHGETSGATLCELPFLNCSWAKDNYGASIKLLLPCLFWFGNCLLYTDII
jgi:hypothetical protein